MLIAYLITYKEDSIIILNYFRYTDEETEASETASQRQSQNSVQVVRLHNQALHLFFGLLSKKSNNHGDLKIILVKFLLATWENCNFC